MKKHTESVLISVLQSREQLKKIIAIYLILVSGFFLLYLFFIWQNYQGVVHARNNELKLLQHWESVVSSHPNYPDAYYQSAIHAARIGNEEKALEYVSKALEFDPYFESAENLKRELIGS